MADEQNENERPDEPASSENSSPKDAANSLPVLPSWNVRGQFNRKSAAFTSGIRIPKMDASLWRKEGEPPTSPEAKPADGLASEGKSVKKNEDTVPPGILRRPVDLRSKDILPKLGNRPNLSKIGAGSSASRLQGPPLSSQQKITDPDLPVVASQVPEEPPAGPKLQLQSTVLAKEMAKQRDTGDMPILNGQNAPTDNNSEQPKDKTRRSTSANPLSKLGTSSFATGTISSVNREQSSIIDLQSYPSPRGKINRSGVQGLRSWDKRYHQRLTHIGIACCLVLGLALLGISVLSDFLAYQAIQQWKANNIEGATRYFDQAIMIEPNSLPLRLKRAQFNLATNHFDQTEKDLQIVLKKEPANIEALEAQASFDLNKKNWASAISEYSKLISLPGKQQPKFFAARGYARLKAGDNKDALQDYSIAKSQDPDNLENLKGYGLALAASDQFEEAANVLDNVISKDPKSQEALVKRAWCLINLKNYAQAQECLDSAKELAPGDPQIYVCLGELNSKQDDLVKAENYFHQALELVPNTISAYEGMARLAKQKGDIDSEYENSKKAFELAGTTSASKVMQIAKLAQADSKYDDAVKYYTSAIKSYPNNFELYSGRAACNEQLGRFVAAFHDYDKLVALSPSAKTYADRAYSNWQGGSRKTAEYDFEIAIGREPHNYYPFFKRGLCYFNEHDYKNAANDFNNALRLKPDAADVRKYMENLGSFEKNSKVQDTQEPQLVADKKLQSKIAHMTLPALLKLGYEQYTSGNVQDSIVVLRQAVRTDPNDAMARRYLAHALHDSKLDGEAAQQINALQSLKALGPDERLFAGEVFKSAGQTSEAISIFQKLIGEDDSNLRALKGLAETYAQSGKVEQAKKLITDASAKAKSDSERSALSDILKGL